MFTHINLYATRLPAYIPHRAVFSAKSKNRHDAHASYPQIPPFFQRVGKVVMMRAQAPLGFPIWPFFQRLWKSVMMRTQAVLNPPWKFFQRTPKPVMMRARRPRMSLRTQRIRAMLLGNGAEAQNRGPQERRIGDGDGKVD